MSDNPPRIEPVDFFDEFVELVIVELGHNNTDECIWEAIDEVQGIWFSTQSAYDDIFEIVQARVQ